MTGVPTLNFVFYSTPKFQPTTREILVDLGKGLGESPWYRVQGSYMTKSSGEPMTPALRFGEESPTVDEGDPCWSGRALTDTSVGAIVTCLIKAGRLPYAANSLSLVLTGPDVAQGADATGAFCSNFCGWHSYTYDAQGRPFKFGFVGSAARCPSACAGQSAASPNGNVEADAMVSPFLFLFWFFSPPVFFFRRRRRRFFFSYSRKKKINFFLSSSLSLSLRLRSSPTRSPRPPPTRSSRPGSTATARRTPTSARGPTAPSGRSTEEERQAEAEAKEAKEAREGRLPLLLPRSRAPEAWPTPRSGAASSCFSSTGPTGPRRATATTNRREKRERESFEFSLFAPPPPPSN